MATLKDTIASLAATFASEITKAIRASNLEDLVTLDEPRTMSIQDWVAAADADLGKRRVSQTHSAPATDAAPVKRRPGRPKGSKNKTAPAVQATESYTPPTPEDVIKYVTAHPGVSQAKLASAIGMGWSTALVACNKKGLLRRKPGPTESKVRYWPLVAK